MILLENTTIISFDKLKQHLIEKLALQQSLQLRTSSHEVTLLYSKNQYLLVDPNDLTKTETFGLDKIDSLTTHLQTIFNSPGLPKILSSKILHLPLNLNPLAESVIKWNKSKNR